jgi:TrmH family RNA methyltransferase
LTIPQSESVITSIHNPGIKRARSFLRRKGRIEERAFLVEGVRAVMDMIATGVRPEIVYLRDDAESRELVLQIPEQVPVRFALPAVVDSLSDVPHPQGVVAVVPMDAVQSEPSFDVWSTDLILVVDGVRDPGNLGTLIRTAAGAGVTEVIVTPDSVDPFNPKCVRSAMGAHFLVPIRQMTREEVVDYLARVSLIAMAEADGALAYAEPDWTESCAIIVGSEAFGANPVIRELANAYVRIPLARDLESLNAGVAGSHVVLEAARQRRSGARFENPVRN